ncbi:PAS domain S-box protein [Natronolimnobius sp. AArcel1]|uniref:bacterio-opsin activator domain-containing protein n=1 Tax=Natronolimnobius sp. AArcel1 TaxID=1679093 RepID=UPI0013ED83DB|nr:bacterio-opsin activator domain-containing protein [Natronolimnobius sp. AArcel1]NGM67511.1 PAS domain S-box protein [Natronolimnobius sp. AArcel1]
MSLEEAGEERVGLSKRQYESLLDAAETYREALVVQLCGAVGLRPAELARLTVGDIEQVRMDPPRYLVRIPDGEDRDGRTAYLPTTVERELRRYARSNDLSADDRLFGVTPRRLQMLVSAVSDRAAEHTDDPALADVSTSDLRQYFVAQALVEHDINPRIVKAAGGWQSFEALERYLEEPTDTALVDAFGAVERPRPGEQQSHEESRTESVLGDSVIRLLLAASDRYALIRLDAEGYVERWNRSAASLFGYRAGEIVGTHLSTFYPDDAVEAGDPDRTLSAALEDAGTEVDGWRVHKDGSRFRATEVVSPLRDDRGRHRGFVVFVRDGTATQDELEEMRAERDTLASRQTIAQRYRALTQGLLEATDHETVERKACRALAAGDPYVGAWIDRTTIAQRQGKRTTAGFAAAAAERLTPDEWPVDGPTTASTGVLTRDVQATIDETSFTGTLAAVELTYGDTTYGTLAVVTSRPEAFDDDECAWLETIGRHIGAAIAAVRRRNLLLSDRVAELEIVCKDSGSFFVETSRSLGCRFELETLVPVAESTQLYYVRLEGSSPAEVFERAEATEGIADCRLVETDAEGWRLEFVVDGAAPTLTLTEYGVTVLEAVIEDGTATITGECAADTELRTVVDGLRAVFPDSKLVGKRETERTVQTAREFRTGLEDQLTDRQEATLRAAYYGGYYDWPRESTAEEIADAMDVSSPTLHNHLRKAQHELLQTFFDRSTGDGEAGRERLESTADTATQS